MAPFGDNVAGRHFSAAEWVGAGLIAVGQGWQVAEGMCQDTQHPMRILIPLLAALAVMADDQPLQPPPIREQYTKYEFMIPMRDGVRLYTAVYQPKDGSRKYPVMLTRTPYSCQPYGTDVYRTALGPSEYAQKAG